MKKILPPQLAFLLMAVFGIVGSVLPVVGPVNPWIRIAGVPIFVGGLAIAFAGKRQFERAETNIDTFNDPDVLITNGLFARTRNPMYLGMLVALVGFAVLIGGLAAWIAPLAFYAASSRWYIPFEERRMAVTFGDEYRAYCRRVPRWITVTPSRSADHQHETLPVG